MRFSCERQGRCRWSNARRKFATSPHCSRAGPPVPRGFAAPSGVPRKPAVQQSRVTRKPVPVKLKMYLDETKLEVHVSRALFAMVILAAALPLHAQQGQRETFGEWTVACQVDRMTDAKRCLAFCNILAFGVTKGQV